LFNVYIPFVNVFGLCMSFRCRDVIYVGDTHALQTLRIYFLSSHSGANRQPRYSFYIHARMASVVQLFACQSQFILFRQLCQLTDRCYRFANLVSYM